MGPSNYNMIQSWNYREIIRQKIDAYKFQRYGDGIPILRDWSAGRVTLSKSSQTVPSSLENTGPHR